MIQRFGAFGLTLALASVVVFLLLDIAPGDPAVYMMGLNADPQAVAALRAELGLDAAPVTRYLTWVSGLIRGDLGVSYTYRVPVLDLVTERLWVTLPLTVLTLTLVVALAIPLGLWSAAHRNQVPDHLVSLITQFGLAIPNFWLALVLGLVFAVHLQWFPAGGFPGWHAGLGAGLNALLLPAIALAAPQAAILTRVLRAALTEAMAEDYMRTALAKGLSHSQALLRHGLRNGLLPVLTVLGLQFSFLLAGAIIIETVFYLPGLGRLIFQAILQRDLIVVKSVVMLLVAAVILVSFAVELLYVWVDPRLRQRRA
jgi:peptide/nickel transport system permease protein